MTALAYLRCSPVGSSTTNARGSNQKRQPTGYRTEHSEGGPASPAMLELGLQSLQSLLGFCVRESAGQGRLGVDAVHDEGRLKVEAAGRMLGEAGAACDLRGSSDPGRGWTTIHNSGTLLPC